MDFVRTADTIQDRMSDTFLDRAQRIKNFPALFCRSARLSTCFLKRNLPRNKDLRGFLVKAHTQTGNFEKDVQMLMLTLFREYTSTFEAPMSFKSLSLSYFKSLETETHIALLRPLRKFSKIQPAIVRPLPTPAPSPVNTKLGNFGSCIAYQFYF